EALKHFEEREKKERRRIIAEVQGIVNKTISEQVDQKMNLMNEEMNQMRLRMDTFERELIKQISAI
ncbi:hypothetical protein PFISCL1PPCAC_16995, partial [Pristionchus fissidentatus]